MTGRLDCPHCGTPVPRAADGGPRPTCPRCGRRVVPADDDEVFSAEVAEPDEVFGAEVAEPEPAPVARRPAPAAAPLHVPGLPFELLPGERVMLRGGFGGAAAWGWTCTATPLLVLLLFPLAVVTGLLAATNGNPAGLVCAAVLAPPLLLAGLWPHLRTGRYWLTTQRLLWKPRFGRKREARLRDVDPADVSGGRLTSSLRVADRRDRFTVRYVSGAARLWGGVLVLGDLAAEDRPAGRGVADVVWWRGARKTGLRQQPGLVVLRPGYVAFLPTGDSQHIGAELVGAAVGEAVAKAFRRTRNFPAGAELPFDVVVGVTSEGDPAAFDQFVEDAVDEYGGVLWAAGDAEAYREEVAFFPGRDAVGFRTARAAVVGWPGRDQADTLARVLGRWTGGERVPKRYPWLRTGAIGLAFAALAALLVVTGVRNDEPAVELGAVAAADVADRAAVPDKAFVTVTGHPDVAHVRRLKPTRKNGPSDLLVVLQEAPTVVLFVPENHDLGQALKATEGRPAGRGKAKAKPADRGDAGREWTVSGRVYAADDDGSPHARIPTRDVQEFVADAGLDDPAAARVLAVGMSPGELRWNVWAAWGFGGVFGTVAALLLVVAARMLVLAVTTRGDGASGM